MLRGDKRAQQTGSSLLGHRERAAQGIDKLDPWVTLLALISVIGSLTEIMVGSTPMLSRLLHLTDAILVLDLVVKLAVLGRRYWSSPWFAIDALSCLPALNLLPGASSALRTMRALRVLRALRLMRTFQVLQTLTGSESTLPQSAEKSATLAILAYAFALLLADSLLLLSATPVVTQVVEGTMMFGSLLGVLMTVGMIRLLLPSLSTQQLRAILQVTMPHQLAQEVGSNPQAYHQTEQADATIVFCDIVGFTSSVEKLQGEIQTVKHHLERVMDVITRAFIQHDLIIDKYIGDSVMAFRGGRLVSGDPAEHARRVVLATLDAQAAVHALQDPHFSRIKVGGASTDKALIGAFGTPQRLSYTILGDGVNLASRLEGAVKQAGTTNLFCAQTHAHAAQLPGVRWRQLGRLSLPGKTSAYMVYEALPDSASAQWEWLDRYHAALASYEAGHLSDALAGFEAADRMRPEADAPSQRWAAQCQRLLSQPQPPAPLPPLVVTK